MEKVLKRSEQATENTWKLEDIYENESLFYKEMEMVNSLLNEFIQYKGNLQTKLVQALDTYKNISYYFGRIYVYANQKNHEDTADGKYQKMSGQSQLLANKLGQYTSWLEPEILELESIDLDSEDLKEYKRFISMILNEKEHVLDSKTEELLAKASDLGQAADNIYSMFNNADIRFQNILDQDGNSHPLTQGNYISYMESSDRTLRKNAFESLYTTYKQFNNTLGSIFYANAKQADFFSKEHKYKNTLEKELSQNEIPTNVYDNLIDSIHSNMEPMHKYVTLRKKILGLDELHMYDVYTSLAKDVDTKYTFEQAKEIVKDGLKPLGEDYISILEEGFNNRWIDVYENEGKRTGAYSWGCYGTHPYVLLNYHETLDNVFTLAHEMGHAIHTYYSNANQNLLNSEYRIFVAEVASTCNEALLIHHLLKKSNDPKEKLYLINYFLDQFKGTMYRQTMFAEFEKITHSMVAQDEVLTGDIINSIYLDLNKKYFGEDMVIDDLIQYEWSRIPHFYTPFYVYQYATSFAAAISISAKILKGEEGIVEKYKQFLSGGCSTTPIDLLKICDVDMSSPEPIQSALQVFSEYVNELERMIS